MFLNNASYNFINYVFYTFMSCALLCETKIGRHCYIMKVNITLKNINKIYIFKFMCDFIYEKNTILLLQITKFI